MRRLLAIVALAILLSACRLLAIGEGGDAPTATPTSIAASVPVALPDQAGGVAHRAGEVVALGSATVTYLGTVTGSDGHVSWFAVDGQPPANPQLVSPDGEVVDLVSDGDRLRSAPWSGDVTTAGRELSLVAGGELITFTVGPVTSGEGPAPSIEVPPPAR